MHCRGCGTRLLHLQYQSRSADEAHTEVLKCSNCPLDIDKFSSERKEPHVYLPRRKLQNSKTPVCKLTNRRLCKILRVTSRSFDSKALSLSKAHASNFLDENSRLFKSYSSGPWKGMSICTLRKTRITLNAYVEDIIVSDSVYGISREYEDFEYAYSNNHVIVPGSNRTSAVCMIDTDLDTDIVDGLIEMFVSGFCPNSLSGYVDNIVLGSISNLNSRAYDASGAEDDKHYFSSKPDGERMWLVRSGSVWFYCRRLMDFSIESFYVDEKIEPLGKMVIAPVLDVEIMVGSPPILIDILVADSGSLSPYDRNVPWILSEMTSLCGSNPYLEKIYVRPFFKTFLDAKSYTDSALYPTDGIVAIFASGTDMKKIKTVRSMELAVAEDMSLKTKQGTSLFKFKSETSIAIGSIVEIRFCVDGKSLEIIEYFQRFDKKTPNDNEAIDSILMSSVARKQDSMTRNLIWRWSNRLRFQMYQRAQSMNPDKNVILDIGTGSGQSTEAFEKAEATSFILVEPDETKCKSLARRLGVRSYDSDPRSAIQAASNLKKGSRKYHILNCSLSDIVSDRPTMTNLKHIVKCAVACFSAQYVVEDIDYLTSSGIGFIGCYYSYDSVDVGDSIVNEGNVVMKRTTETEASVKWGSDKEYLEPVINQMDIPMSVASVDAIHMVPPEQVSSSHRISKICSHVKVLIST